MTQYSYRKNDDQLTFEKGVELLSKKYQGRVFTGYPDITYSSEENRHLLSLLGQMKIEVEYLRADKNEYLDYIKKAKYERLYPKYYSWNFHEKTFEHFVAFKLLNLDNGDNFLDIAAETSPHSEIFSRLTGCNSFQQDIMFKKGIHGNKIGSSATQIPLKNDSIQGAILACSIEHFENNDDIDSVKEIVRLLDNTGKIVILPLYLHQFAFCITDPRFAVPNDVRFDENIKIHCIPDWANRHGRFYSAETLYERLIKPNQDKMKFKIYYMENFKEIHESLYCRFVLVGEKIGIQKRKPPLFSQSPWKLWPF